MSLPERLDKQIWQAIETIEDMREQAGGASGLLKLITNQPGQRVPVLAALLNTSPKNVEHKLK